MKLKLIAYTEVQVAMFGVAGLLEREAIIEAKRTNWKVKTQTNSEIGGERIKC